MFQQDHFLNGGQLWYQQLIKGLGFSLSKLKGQKSKNISEHKNEIITDQLKRLHKNCSYY